MKATIDQVEKHPAEYLDRVLEGETVVLVQNDRPVAEIRPLNTALGPRPIGLAAGDFVVSDDFDAPLPDDLVGGFEANQPARHDAVCLVTCRSANTSFSRSRHSRIASARCR